MSGLRLLPLVPAAALIVRTTVRHARPFGRVLRSRTDHLTEGRAGTRSIRAAVFARRRRRASSSEV